MAGEPTRQISPTAECADQLDRCLRRAFETDVTAPLPEHLQRLIDAMQNKLPRSDP